MVVVLAGALHLMSNWLCSRPRLSYKRLPCFVYRTPVNVLLSCWFVLCMVHCAQIKQTTTAVHPYVETPLRWAENILHMIELRVVYLWLRPQFLPPASRNWWCVLSMVVLLAGALHLMSNWLCSRPRLSFKRLPCFVHRKPVNVLLSCWFVLCMVHCAQIKQITTAVHPYVDTPLRWAENILHMIELRVVYLWLRPQFLPPAW